MDEFSNGHDIHGDEPPVTQEVAFGLLRVLLDAAYFALAGISAAVTYAALQRISF